MSQILKKSNACYSRNEIGNWLRQLIGIKNKTSTAPKVQLRVNGNKDENKAGKISLECDSYLGVPGTNDDDHMLTSTNGREGERVVVSMQDLSTNNKTEFSAC